MKKTADLDFMTLCTDIIFQNENSSVTRYINFIVKNTYLVNLSLEKLTYKRLLTEPGRFEKTFQITLAN